MLSPENEKRVRTILSNLEGFNAILSSIDYEETETTIQGETKNQRIDMALEDIKNHPDCDELTINVYKNDPLSPTAFISFVSLRLSDETDMILDYGIRLNSIVLLPAEM